VKQVKVVVGVLVAVVVAVASWVGSSGIGANRAFISTPEAVAALHAAGFTNLGVVSNRKAYELMLRGLGNPDARRDALKQAADQDTIVVGRPNYYANGREMAQQVFANVYLVRFPAALAASIAYRQSSGAVSDRAALAQWRRSGLLPRGFRPDRYREEQICNVIVTSYNPLADQRISLSFDRAIDQLQDAC
jgi:hypothetical protein